MKKIIKCDPGWYLVAEYFQPQGDPNHPGFYRSPIIAWEIDTDEDPLVEDAVCPITIHGRAATQVYWAIQRPDGIVEDPGTQEVFESPRAFESAVLVQFELDKNRT